MYWQSLFVPDTPARLGSRQAVACSPPHGSFTPTAVLTEPPPLCEAVAGREYHCHSDCHRHTGSNPALTKGVLARHGWDRSFREPHFNGSWFSNDPASWRTLLWWLVLSHIGTDVLDEWVFGCQGALRGLWPSQLPTTTFNASNRTYFFKKSKTNFSKAAFLF